MRMWTITHAPVMMKHPPSVATKAKVPPSQRLGRDGFVVRRRRHRVDAAAPKHAAAALTFDTVDAAAAASETEPEIQHQRDVRNPIKTAVDFAQT